MTQTLSTEPRLRPHPEQRFAAEQIAVDLAEAAARLRCEPHAGEGGRRQETLYHREGGLTVALFTFDRFTHLPQHKANGVVTMQGLRGRLKITAGDRVHQIGEGQLLLLAPGVPYSVAAEEESEMLVTVALTPSNSAAAH